MHDPHSVSTIEHLRAVIPEPSPIVQRKILTTLDDFARQFIGESPLVFVSTSDKHFNIDVSPKGDELGFVRIEDQSTLLIPERPGNRLAFGFQNIIETGAISLIFVVPGVRETLRVAGSATITRDPMLLQQFVSNDKPALLCTRVVIRECFFHCGKALIRSKLWQPDAWKSVASNEGVVKHFSSTLGVAEPAFREMMIEDYRCNL